jgi:hypothetical protein
MGRVGIREAPKADRFGMSIYLLQGRRSLRWEAFNNLIESLAQSPGVSESNVVKPCLIVLLASTTFSRTAGKASTELFEFRMEGRASLLSPLKILLKTLASAFRQQECAPPLSETGGGRRPRRPSLYWWSVP